MNFSDFLTQSNDIVRYSPSGDLVAIARTFEVKVKIGVNKMFLDLRDEFSKANAFLHFYRCGFSP